ncbi:MAG: hypothetical protein EOM50_03635 [Erysipelotrichia bacterium]|nr:hypothetical protein [Erysipelotrichia bacterium]NCC54474.1 hypothetical protein [Erysipelotrichia bacterium]
MAYRYFLAYDNGNIVIRDFDDGNIERYDSVKKEWVQDFDMSQIYYGGIPVKPLTEKEAFEQINKGVRIDVR